MAKEEKAVETTEEVEAAAVETTEETAPKASAKKPEKKPAKTEKKPKSDKPGFFKRIARFFKDLKGEVKKIVWPTKKQVLNNTIVVITVCVIVGVFVFGLDLGLGFLRDLVLKRA